MRVLIASLAIFLLFPFGAFCGEIISSGVEIKDGIYFLNLKIRVDIKKDRAMEIFNDSEKLKSLSHVIKKVVIVEKLDGDVIKKTRELELCLFHICMEAVQNSVLETGDDAIEISVSNQMNFSSGLMHVEVVADSDGKTVINCKVEVKPKFLVRSCLSVISKERMEKKLIDVAEKLINKIESFEVIK